MSHSIAALHQQLMPSWRLLQANNTVKFDIVGQYYIGSTVVTVAARASNAVSLLNILQHPDLACLAVTLPTASDHWYVDKHFSPSPSLSAPAANIAERLFLEACWTQIDHVANTHHLSGAHLMTCSLVRVML